MRETTSELRPAVGGQLSGYSHMRNFGDDVARLYSLENFYFDSDYEQKLDSGFITGKSGVLQALTLALPSDQRNR